MTEKPTYVHAWHARNIHNIRTPMLPQALPTPSIHQFAVRLTKTYARTCPFQTLKSEDGFLIVIFLRRSVSFLEVLQVFRLLIIRRGHLPLIFRSLHISSYPAVTVNAPVVRAG
jgi:hypothetical protein